MNEPLKAAGKCEAFSEVHLSCHDSEKCVKLSKIAKKICVFEDTDIEYFSAIFLLPIFLFSSLWILQFAHFFSFFYSKILL